MIRKPRHPEWGFGPVAARLYWPGVNLTASERAVGWAPCADWKTCRDIAPGFVPGFPHSHRTGTETLEQRVAARMKGKKNSE